MKKWVCKLLTRVYNPSSSPTNPFMFPNRIKRAAHDVLLLHWLGHLLCTQKKNPEAYAPCFRNHFCFKYRNIGRHYLGRNWWQGSESSFQKCTPRRRRPLFLSLQLLIKAKLWQKNLKAESCCTNTTTTTKGVWPNFQDIKRKKWINSNNIPPQRHNWKQRKCLFFICSLVKHKYSQSCHWHVQLIRTQRHKARTTNSFSKFPKKTAVGPKQRVLLWHTVSRRLEAYSP